jgi:hypothetical protein
MPSSLPIRPPETCSPADLAIALHNLALQLAYRGQREDALTTSKKPGASRYATR